MPDPQARRLLDADTAGRLLDDRPWEPSLAVVLGWSGRRWPADLHGAFVHDDPAVTWVADDGDRRGDGAPVLVAHTTNDAARRYDGCPDDAVAPVLDALRELLGVRSAPVWTHVHRWRYAAPADSREDLFHLGADGIGLAGDGWGSSRVETAWRSGTRLGRALAERARTPVVQE
jgi:renalase